MNLVGQRSHSFEHFKNLKGRPSGDNEGVVSLRGKVIAAEVAVLDIVEAATAGA